MKHNTKTNQSELDEDEWVTPQVWVPGPIMFQAPAGGPNHVNDQKKLDEYLELESEKRRRVSYSHKETNTNRLE